MREAFNPKAEISRLLAVEYAKGTTDPTAPVRLWLTEPGKQTLEPTHFVYVTLGGLLDALGLNPQQTDVIQLRHLALKGKRDRALKEGA
jgi:hypothetical protein